MTFWDHLEEFRKAIIQPILLLVLLTIVAFLLREPIFNVVLAPNSPDFITYRWIGSLSPFADSSSQTSLFVQMINTELTAQFLMHIKVSFFVALMLTMPFLFYKLFHFASPGLFQNERKYSKRVIFFSFLSFLCGILISYFIIFPFSFRFLSSYQVSVEVHNMISLTSYINTLVTLSILMGIFFELPVMSWILSRLGLLQASFMKKYRRHAIIIIMILAAFITPTTDIFTLLLVSLPIILLYELSILIAKSNKKSPLKEH